MTAFYRYPVDNPVITGTFGQPYTNDAGQVYLHRGVDFGSLALGAPIYAPCPMDRIPLYNPDGSFGDGLSAVIPDGRFILLAHNSAVLLPMGMHAETGAVVALAGATGTSRPPGAVHCHWQFSPYQNFPVDIALNLDPLLELDDAMMSPEERARLEAVELATYGGQAGVQTWLMRGQPLASWADDLNAAVKNRVNEHSGFGAHGNPYGSVFGP